MSSAQLIVRVRVFGRVRKESKTRYAVRYQAIESDVIPGCSGLLKTFGEQVSFDYPEGTIDSLTITVVKPRKAKAKG